MARDEQGNIFFDAEEQAKVDAVIQERVARVKAEKPADYEDYKAIGEELQAFGYKGTVAEIRAEIRRQREETAAQQELAELQQQAANVGTSPELLKEMRELKKEIDELKTERDGRKQEQEKKEKQTATEKAQEEAYNKQRASLIEKHNVDAEDLEKNAKFMKFVKGKTITDLVETYEDFIDFVGESEAEVLKKVMSKEARSTSGGKGSNSGGGHGLTSEQKATVDQWNQRNPKMQMSYKDYAERL